jgi:hypothetical protein
VLGWRICGGGWYTITSTSIAKGQSCLVANGLGRIWCYGCIIRQIVAQERQLWLQQHKGLGTPKCVTTGCRWVKGGKGGDKKVCLGKAKAPSSCANVVDLHGSFSRRVQVRQCTESFITDQNGNEKLPATLQNVKHVRSAKFNLFSLTKRQKAGWLLNKDSEKIWITKGEHKIVFNI